MAVRIWSRTNFANNSRLSRSLHGATPCLIVRGLNKSVGSARKYHFPSDESLSSVLLGIKFYPVESEVRPPRRCSISSRNSTLYPFVTLQARKVNIKLRAHSVLHTR